MSAKPAFAHEERIPTEVEGGAAFSRLYLGGDGKPACVVLYNAAQMVLTDFRRGTANAFPRDLSMPPAADCDRLVERLF